MQIKNSTTHFGLVAILFHWIIALLIIGLLAEGLYMVNIPISIQKLRLYGWHKEYGFIVLFLAIFRIIWRLGNQMPELTALSWLERLAARSMHWAFYGFMFALPLSGWLLTSASGLPVSFFGLFTLPTLINPDESTRLCLQLVHEWLAYALIAAIALHSAAALKHHFINKDEILRRMLW